MFGGDGTIDYNVGAPSLDTQKTSTEQQELTNREVHGRPPSTLHLARCTSFLTLGLRCVKN